MINSENANNKEHARLREINVKTHQDDIITHILLFETPHAHKQKDSNTRAPKKLAQET